MIATLAKNLLVFIAFSVLTTIISLKVPTKRLDYRNWLYRERKWEDGGAIYQRIFKVKGWKKIVPELGDFIPSIFPKKKIASLHEEYIKKYLVESCRAELTHWGIILSSLLFLIWSDRFWTLTMIALALIINLPYIIIQRYNRPRIIAHLSRSTRRTSHTAESDMHASEAGTPGRIMIISAEDTGHGHKSITQALCSQLSRIAPDIRVSVVDGFSLGNKLLQLTARLYNPLVVNMPALWGMFYKAGDHVTKLINAYVSKSIRGRLLKRIEEENPDLIVSVHAVFIGSVLNILERENIDIPVVPFIADLDNVSGLWADKRAKYTLCPSPESKQHMRVLGISEDKLKAVGFPVREEFCESSGAVAPDGRIHAKSRASVLFVCGSQGSRRICRMAQAVLEHTDCTISIMAGNNPALKKYLERKLSPGNENRVQIHGFTLEIKKHILEADILVVRASPNVLMEAVNLCKPLIVTGAFRGQEAKNPAFVAKYHLGVVCKGCRELPDTIMTLLSENGQRLNEIYTGQMQFRNPRAAQEIAELLVHTCYETHNDNYVSVFANSSVPKQETTFVAFSDLQTNLANK